MFSGFGRQPGRSMHRRIDRLRPGDAAQGARGAGVLPKSGRPICRIRFVPLIPVDLSWYELFCRVLDQHRIDFFVLGCFVERDWIRGDIFRLVTVGAHKAETGKTSRSTSS